LVKKRGELMSQATDGGMAAILNASKEEIEWILEKNNLTGIDLANYNTPSQIVISGLIDEIVRAQSFFQQGEILFYPLNTSGAFHSRYMQSAKEKFENYIKKFKLLQPKIPVIANVTAQPYKGSEVTKNLSAQISSTVKWCESVQYLMELAATSNDAIEFVEVGHSDVLTKLVHTIKQQTPSTIGEKTFSIENQNAVVQKTETKSASSKDADSQTTPIDKIIKSLNETKPTFISAEEKVNAWNKKYSIGTKVKSTYTTYENLETRTEAMVLFGHRAAVYMKEYNGYFDLDEIAAV
jgi:acyl transferase domain-containing protein